LVPSVSIDSAFSRGTQQSGSGSDSPLGSVAVVTSPGQRLSDDLADGLSVPTTDDHRPDLPVDHLDPVVEDPASQPRTNSLELQR
jgi:hypothetical protein